MLRKLNIFCVMYQNSKLNQLFLNFEIILDSSKENNSSLVLFCTSYYLRLKIFKNRSLIDQAKVDIV